MTPADLVVLAVLLAPVLLAALVLRLDPEEIAGLATPAVQ